MNAWKLLRKDPNAEAAAALYAATVSQARQLDFYAAGGVPDSVDGRFEMIVLHSYLVLSRLRQAGEAGRELAQSLVDAIFADLDASLREMGAGDLGVGKRVKRMATAFYGRVSAYEEGEATGTMGEALRRNLFGTAEPDAAQLAEMTGYVEAARRALASQPLGSIAKAELIFPTLGKATP
jgi:cytochrome b pre-mRNA-processing protein 3